jgi:hypothetical protein
VEAGVPGRAVSKTLAIWLAALAFATWLAADIAIKVDEARQMRVLVKAASSIAHDICEQNSTVNSPYNGC